MWLIVETSQGEKGYIPTAFSWTNIPSSWKGYRPWEDKFYEFNPREKFKWNEEILALIHNGKIKIGMDKEQAKLSWGNPNKINKNILQDIIQEQWVYHNKLLYFDNGKLTAIQDY